MEPKPRKESSGGASARPLALATAVVFAISLLFPLGAGLSKHTEEFPKWWGIADVAVAFLLAALSFAVLVVAKGKISPHAEHTTYRAYRVLIHGVFVMLLVFVIMRDRVIWENCLSGFAWRSWLLLYCLPAWFAALRPSNV